MIPAAATPISADAGRVKRHIATRFNPLRGLTPERLARYLEDFDAGILRDAALVWQKMQERDDMIVTVDSLRCLAVEQLDYEILPVDDSPEAAAHKEALEWAYSNLSARHALDRSFSGEASSLFGQMLDAQAKRWAVHELVWRQDRQGNVSADFWFVPLWFFESRTGELRFLPQEGAYEGISMEPGKWMVTRGRGIMQACSVAYMFKHLPLNDWLLYCEKFGVPGLHGSTPAPKDSPEWDALVEALAAFGVDWSIVTSPEAKITPVVAGSVGTQPHPELVDRMDRAIARMWRGGDLSTMSADQGAVGSQPQAGENAAIAAGDAALITSTLQRQFDRQVIAIRFGQGVKPLAYFHLNPPTEVDDARELQIDQGLVNMGVRLGEKDLLERYGRAEPDPTDTIVTRQPAAASPFAPPGMPIPPRPAAFANQRSAIGDPQSAGEAAIEKSLALAELAKARAASAQPLLDRLARLEAAADPVAYAAELRSLQSDLPSLYAQIARDDQLVDAFAASLGAIMAKAATQATAS